MGHLQRTGACPPPPGLKADEAVAFVRVRVAPCRRKAPSERRVAVLLYGFPPGVGAVGTAALLNVPQSLQALLRGLAKEGYHLGPHAGRAEALQAPMQGEAVVSALAGQDQQRVVSRGAAGASRCQGTAAAEEECAGVQSLPLPLALLRLPSVRTAPGGPPLRLAASAAPHPEAAESGFSPPGSDVLFAARAWLHGCRHQGAGRGRGRAVRVDGRRRRCHAAAAQGALIRSRLGTLRLHLACARRSPQQPSASAELARARALVVVCVGAQAWLTYPPEWGPTEWGPMPYLPDNDVLVRNMERQWGELRSYR